MIEIQTIDFPENLVWLDGPLPFCPSRPPSGWTGIEKIMPALLDRFNVGRQYALEFGVEYGWSISVLAQLFDHVTGVDLFVGDPHSGERPSYYEETRGYLEKRENVTLVQEDYRRWIKHDRLHYDLIHVDLVHTFEATYTAGRWAADHAPVVIFHDTEAFWPEVKEAIAKIAEETNRSFYNYPKCYGLGIIV